MRTSLVTVDWKDKVNAKIRENSSQFLNYTIFFFLGVQSLRVDQETEDFVTIRVVFNERIKLLNLGVSVLSFYSERNTKNDLFVCMLLVASKAVGVSRTAYCMDFF